MLGDAERQMTDEEKQEKLTDGKPLIPLPAPSVLLMGQHHSAYLLDIIKKVRPVELEEALLVLPFSSALTLLVYLNEWLQQVMGKGYHDAHIYC